jgi:GrpB-like predicted nucleotidyltransferase (UPF0157 family)
LRVGLHSTDPGDGDFLTSDSNDPLRHPSAGLEGAVFASADEVVGRLVQIRPSEIGTEPDFVGRVNLLCQTFPLIHLIGPNTRDRCHCDLNARNLALRTRRGEVSRCGARGFLSWLLRTDTRHARGIEPPRAPPSRPNFDGSAGAAAPDNLVTVADRIAVVAYDPAWQRKFDEERLLLERVLRPWLEGEINHVGSTAIPGLAAKPVIDMIAGVADLDEARAAFDPLSTLSYVYTPHRPHIAHHFSKPSAALSTLTHNLHLTEVGSDLWRERLAFRDALRESAVLANEYAVLKQRLAEEHPTDGGAYTAGKREFVGRVLASAGITFGPRRATGG